MITFYTIKVLTDAIFVLGPFKYYVSMFLTFLTPPTHLISRHQHFLIPTSNMTSAFPQTHPPTSQTRQQTSGRDLYVFTMELLALKKPW